MYQTVVAVLCGPHNKDGSISFCRIDRGIEEAQCLKTTLVIAGDGNCGSDVQCFVGRARTVGLTDVIGLYDPGRCTLTDAQSIAKAIGQRVHNGSGVHVHLVTDWWHMPRATIMLLGEMKEVKVGQFKIACVNVESQTPATHVLRGEVQGITDYMAGTYGQRTAYEPWGKPASEPQQTHV